MDDLYREELMEIYRDPPNRGSMEDPTVEVDKDNPLCGDEIVLQLKVIDGVITQAKFDGEACAVSIISSAMLTEYIEGKSVEEAKKITKEKLLDHIGMNLTTSRVKCATLALDALQSALEGF